MKICNHTAFNRININQNGKYKKKKKQPKNIELYYSSSPVNDTFHTSRIYFPCNKFTISIKRFPRFLSISFRKLENNTKQDLHKPLSMNTKVPRSPTVCNSHATYVCECIQSNNIT